MKAVTLLVRGATRAETATAVGVDRRTVDRWCALPAFAAELADARREVIDGATRRLEALVTDALTALETIIGDATAPPATRVRCIEIVLHRCGIDAAKESTAVAADPADVNEVLAFMRWRDEQGRGARDEGDDAA